MAATDRERQQAHDHAKRQWTRLHDTTTVPQSLRLELLSTPKVKPVSTPPRPEQPAPVSAAAVATRLTAGIPTWAFGERRFARRLVPDRLAEIAQHQTEAYRRARDEHRDVVIESELRQDKSRRDQAAEQRLISGLRERRDGGDEEVTRFLAGELLNRLPFSVHMEFSNGKATLLVPAVPLDKVPERQVATTAAGKPTTKKLNKSERHDAQASAIAKRGAGAARLLANTVPATARFDVWAITREGETLGHLSASAGEIATARTTELERGFVSSIGRKGTAGNLVSERPYGLAPDLVQEGTRLA